MRVSILIPCFNAERWVAQAIESALDQTWPDKEVIVVDDGSTDRSVEIIKAFDGRIRWESGSNRGSNHARNRLTALASGPWLQYLDADDYLLADKIERQVGFVRAHPDIDVVYGPITLEFSGDRGREVLPIVEPRDEWVLLARWFLPQTGAPLWRKQAVIDVGGWAIDQPACQEHELYLRLLMARKRFAFCEHGGAIYRQWSETTLWRADQPRTRQLRLQIEDRAEAFLRANGMITDQRLWAINQARFELARNAWQHHPSEARAIVSAIGRSDPAFVPAGTAAPPSYRWLYRALGFVMTERLAGWRRKLAAGPKAALA